MFLAGNRNASMRFVGYFVCCLFLFGLERDLDDGATDYCEILR